MRLYFLKDFEEFKEGESSFVELSRGRRLVDKFVAIPFVTHLENVEREKRDASEKRAEELKAKKEAAAPEKQATSKRATTRKKAVKK